MTERQTTGQIIALWREDPERADLIKRLYYDKDVLAAARRFYHSDEFQAVLEIAQKYGHPTGKVVDIGGGNGVAALAWAMAGYKSFVIDPDRSEVVGLGAVPDSDYDIHTIQASGELLPIADATFDIVYGRQVLHHILALSSATREVYRVLKPGGVSLFTREHIVDHPAGLARFLERHVLHCYTGEENAYREDEYLDAFKQANLIVAKILHSHDSVINLYPVPQSDINKSIIHKLRQYIPSKSLCWRLAKLKFVRLWIQSKLSEEDTLQGRLYTFILTKSRIR